MYSATINKTHNFVGYYDVNYFPDYDFGCKWVTACSCGWAGVTNDINFQGGYLRWNSEVNAKIYWEKYHLPNIDAPV